MVVYFITFYTVLYNIQTQYDLMMKIIMVKKFITNVSGVSIYILDVAMNVINFTVQLLIIHQFIDARNPVEVYNPQTAKDLICLVTVK